LMAVTGTGLTALHLQVSVYMRRIQRYHSKVRKRAYSTFKLSKRLYNLIEYPG